MHAPYSPEERRRLVLAVIGMVRDGTPARRSCTACGVPMSVFYTWLEADPELVAAYEKARKMLYNHWAEDLIEIADTPREALIEKMKHDGFEITRKDAIEHRRMQIDTRKWLLSKLEAGKYGDKVQVGGASDLPPIQSSVTMTPDEAYRAMLGKGAGK